MAEDSTGLELRDRDSPTSTIFGLADLLGTTETSLLVVLIVGMSLLNPAMATGAEEIFPLLIGGGRTDIETAEAAGVSADAASGCCRGENFDLTGLFNRVLTATSELKSHLQMMLLSSRSHEDQFLARSSPDNSFFDQLLRHRVTHDVQNIFQTLSEFLLIPRIQVVQRIASRRSFRVRSAMFEDEKVKLKLFMDIFDHDLTSLGSYPGVLGRQDLPPGPKELSPTVRARSAPSWGCGLWSRCRCCGGKCSFPWRWTATFPPHRKSHRRTRTSRRHGNRWRPDCGRRGVETSWYRRSLHFRGSSCLTQDSYCRGTLLCDADGATTEHARGRVK